MKPYAATLADVTAEYPAVVFTPEDFRDGDEDGFTVSGETIAAIASPYLYELNYLPARYPTPVVTVGGAARRVISYNPDASPGVGEVAICFDGPQIIEFYSGDNGLVPSVSYTALGKPVVARHLNKWQKELVAIATLLNTVAPSTLVAVSKIDSYPHTGTTDPTELAGYDVPAIVDYAEGLALELVVGCELTNPTADEVLFTLALAFGDDTVINHEIYVPSASSRAWRLNAMFTLTDNNAVGAMRMWATIALESDVTVPMHTPIVSENSLTQRLSLVGTLADGACTITREEFFVRWQQPPA